MYSRVGPLEKGGWGDLKPIFSALGQKACLLAPTVLSPRRPREITMTPFRSHIPALLFLAGIFFLNFLSRIILAPLLPAIEGDLQIGHRGAGSLFLFISLGYCVGVLGSRVVSSRFTHRRTIIASSMAVGV